MTAKNPAEAVAILGESATIQLGILKKKQKKQKT
jgi:hypothetical protein